MPIYRAQVILKTDDDVVENFSSNSWAFNCESVPDFTQITTALKGFYDDLATYWPSPMAQSGHEVKYYELPGLAPNYPVAVNSWNLASNPSQTPFPSEVAVCLSFQAQRVSGLPQARRRGRLYIGPLGSNASGTDGRPSSTFVGVLVDAAEAFKTALESVTVDTDWVIWSSTTAGISAVDEGWVDNAWDTQRRRGIQPSARVEFTFV